MLLNNQWITEEVKEGIKKYLGINDNENMTMMTQTYGMQQNSSSRGVCSNRILPQETEKHKRNLTLHLKPLAKEQNTKIVVERNHKDWSRSK